MRFVLDHDVDATLRGVLQDAGHECWTAGDARLATAGDDALSVYAHDKAAALLSHDRAFAKRRRDLLIGQHVWLKCVEMQAVDLVVEHLSTIVSILEHVTDVLVVVSPSGVLPVPGTWP